jgi:hypothetical protein
MRPFNRACAPVTGAQTLIRLNSDSFIYRWSIGADRPGSPEPTSGSPVRTFPFAASLLPPRAFSVDLGRWGAGYSLLSNDENEVIAKLNERGGQLIYHADVIVSHLVAAERLTQTWFWRRVA